MKPLKILTTAAVAGALVAGGIAGPAVAANPDVQVQAVISVSTTAMSVPAFTPSTQINVNTTALGNGYLNLWLIKDGAVFDAGPVFQDDAGNTSIDVLKELSYTVFNYGDVPAGSYAAYLTSAQTSDYAYPTSTVYLAAQSPTIAFNVTKVKTKITGWKPLKKSAKYGKLIRLSSPTVVNGGTGKWIFQYKKKGSKTWHTSESGTVPYSKQLKWKFKTQAFNKIHNKRAKRGTYYVRVVIPKTAFVSGAKTKQARVTWK